MASLLVFFTPFNYSFQSDDAVNDTFYMDVQRIINKFTERALLQALLVTIFWQIIGRR